MKFYFSSSALLCLSLYLSLVANAQHIAPQLGKNSVAQVIRAMTLEEKVKMVVGKGFALPGTTTQDTV